MVCHPGLHADDEIVGPTCIRILLVVVFVLVVVFALVLVPSIALVLVSINR